MINKSKIESFLEYVVKLKGDEKGEAQLFCDRLFRTFGHGGIIEANGTLEARIKFNIENKTKFADCLWCPKGRAGVLIEMKKRSFKNLESCFTQARDYWLNMNPTTVLGEGCDKPRYIMLCNFSEIILYKDCHKVDNFKIEELTQRYTALNFLLPEEKEPIFQNNTENISKEAAEKIGELYQYLTIDKKEDSTRARHFLLQCVLSLFSEDFELLPKGMFTEIIRDCKEGKANSYDLIGGLFRQMASPIPAKGGRFKEVKYFNGGLFKEVDPIELDPYSLNILYEVALKDWTLVHPAIFGALFEGTMDSKERHKFGAHFTNETDMLQVITPTIIKPWKEKIEKANTLRELKDLLKEIGEYKVLDPACGCGNFLFVAYRELRELECQIFEKMNDLSKASGKKKDKLYIGQSHIQTNQFFGLDILPMAVEVAKMTMMIAKEVVADICEKRLSAFSKVIDFEDRLPLENMDKNILERDALLDEWPAFNVVIGNPPYQAKNKMSSEMDLAYVDQIRKTFPDVPRRADFCVYWFHKTHQLMQDGQYAGLVGTNTIRQNYSRMGGLDYITANKGTILDSVSTKVWSGDAAVHVSIVTWKKGEDNKSKQLIFQRGDNLHSPFEYFQLDHINSSLSLEDVSTSQPLICNQSSSCCYQGQTHGHEGFLLPRKDAESLLTQHPEYNQVLFPYLIGNDLLHEKDSLPKRYIIDFRKKDIFEAAKYDLLYQIIKEKVYPTKKEKADIETERNNVALKINPAFKRKKDHQKDFEQWWQPFRSRDELMDLISKQNKYICCSRVTKRPIFEFISSNIHPGDALQVFPLEDDYSFGILQSDIHWEWFTARCSTLKGDWRYTSNSVFDTFPWPQQATLKQVKEIALYSRLLREKRREIMNKNHYSLRELYRLIEDAPNNPISELQEQLNLAVRHAYGMKKNESVLPFLLRLNHTLSQNEANNKFVQKPGLPDFITNKKDFISNDCIKMK